MRVCPWHPYSVTTGDLIRNCPSTLEELDALPCEREPGWLMLTCLADGEVDALLTELGETVRGRIDDKKEAV